MAPEAPSKAPRAGLSLYANLLDPSSSSGSTPGTISRAPVVFNQSAGEDSRPDEGSAQKQQISAGRYQSVPCVTSYFVRIGLAHGSPALSLQ